ncbi:MAG: hypothetical protein ABEK59_00990 [Halobacteria archaeon]
MERGNDSPRSAEDGRQRGQIGLDFLSGMTIFVVTMIFIFGFLSTSIQPFTQGNDASIDVPNRVATKLYGQEMRTPSEAPGILNKTESEDFFSGSSYPKDGSEVKNLSGISKDRGLNVTAYNNTDDTVLNTGGVDWSIGGNVPDSGGSTNTITRIGKVENEGTVRVEVTVW